MKYLTKFFRWRMDCNIAKLDALVVLADEHRVDWNVSIPMYVIPNSLSFFPEESAQLIKKEVIPMNFAFTSTKSFTREHIVRLTILHPVSLLLLWSSNLLSFRRILKKTGI